MRFRTKSIILILVVCFAWIDLRGQDAKSDSDKKVKPEVGTLEAAWQPVAMDYIIGFRGGYGAGNIRPEPRQNTMMYRGLKNGGIFFRFDAPEQKYVGCIEFTLSYLEKGFILEEGEGKLYSRSYSMIEFPVLWQPYLPLSSVNPSSRIFLNAGPYIGYALRSNYRLYTSADDVTISEGEYQYILARDNRMEYGLVIGGGFQVAVKRVTMGFDFRYNVMLSNIMKSKNRYAENPYRSPVDQMSISFSVGYKINRNKMDRKVPLVVDSDQLYEIPTKL